MTFTPAGRMMWVDTWKTPRSARSSRSGSSPGGSTSGTDPSPWVMRLNTAWSLMYSPLMAPSISTRSRHSLTSAIEPAVARKNTMPVLYSLFSSHRACSLSASTSTMSVEMRTSDLAIFAASGKTDTPAPPIQGQGDSNHSTSTSDIMMSHPAVRRPRSSSVLRVAMVRNTRSSCRQYLPVVFIVRLPNATAG